MPHQLLILIVFDNRDKLVPSKFESGRCSGRCEQAKFMVVGDGYSSSKKPADSLECIIMARCEFLTVREGLTGPHQAPCRNVPSKLLVEPRFSASVGRRHCVVHMYM
jgi:hypothetical protein